MSDITLDGLDVPPAPRRVRRKAATKSPAALVKVRRHRTGAGARLNADNYWVYIVIVVGVIATIAAGIIASWEGLIHVAEWGIFPAELRLLMPVLIDLPISVLALASLALKSRGRPGLSLLMLGLSILFTAFAGIANFIYVGDKVGLDDYKDWTAALFKGIAPAITLVMVEVLGVLVAKPAGEKTKLLRALDENKALKRELGQAKKAAKQPAAPAAPTVRAFLADAAQAVEPRKES